MECVVTTPTNDASVAAVPDTIAATNVQPVQPVVADPQSTAPTASTEIIPTAMAPSEASTPETSAPIVGNTLFGYRSLFLHQHLSDVIGKFQVKRKHTQALGSQGAKKRNGEVIHFMSEICKEFKLRMTLKKDDMVATLVFFFSSFRMTYLPSSKKSWFLSKSGRKQREMTRLLRYWSVVSALTMKTTALTTRQTQPHWI